MKGVLSNDVYKTIAQSRYCGRFLKMTSCRVFLFIYRQCDGGSLCSQKLRFIIFLYNPICYWYIILLFYYFCDAMKNKKLWQNPLQICNTNIWLASPSQVMLTYLYSKSRPYKFKASCVLLSCRSAILLQMFTSALEHRGLFMYVCFFIISSRNKFLPLTKGI